MIRTVYRDALRRNGLDPLDLDDALRFHPVSQTVLQSVLFSLKSETWEALVREECDPIYRTCIFSVTSRFLLLDACLYAEAPDQLQELHAQFF